MAFSKKTWKNRVSEQPQRRLLTPTDGGTSYTVDVTRQEGIVVEEGDAFSAQNMNDLEQRIKNTFDSDEATLNTVNQKANTNASNISSLQTNVSGISSRVTQNTSNISSLTTRVTAVEGKANTNQSNISALSTRVTNVENKATTNQNNISGLTTRMGTAEGNITSLGNRAGTLENELTANSKRIYMDYKNGKYGINTSANRGADTFIPFKPSISTYTLSANVRITSDTLHVVTQTFTLAQLGLQDKEIVGAFIINASGRLFLEEGNRQGSFDCSCSYSNGLIYVTWGTDRYGENYLRVDTNVTANVAVLYYD